MSTAKDSPDWTADEQAEFRDKLLSFRKQLPKDQRRALNAVLAGAAATLRLAETTEGRKAPSFAESLIAFRDGLPSRQQGVINAIMNASALAWGVEAGRAAEASPAQEGPMGDGGQGVVYFWHWVHLARTAAVIIAGAITVIDEATDDDEDDVEAPDLSGIPSHEEIP